MKILPLSPEGFGSCVVFLLLILSLVSNAVAAPPENYVRIKNKWTGEYLYSSGRMCMYVNPLEKDMASHWELVKVSGTNPSQYFIKNRENGYCLSASQGIDYVECETYVSASDEQKWVLESDVGFERIRSVAGGSDYLHTENKKGYAECGIISTVWSSAKWVLEPALTNNVISRGGDYPWIAYEAESMITNGIVLGPSTMPGNLNFASESSQRKCVRLDAVGKYVEFTALSSANAMIVRASIPDSVSGGGQEGTISFYINGDEIADFVLSSRYCYIYNYQEIDDTLWSDDPSVGGVSRFYFDDGRFLLSDFGLNIEAGDTVKLQINTDDMGADPGSYCVVDLVELEDVSSPANKPSGYYSIIDYGATSDDEIDDTEALKACIDAVMEDGAKGVWIPKGDFLQNDNIELENITIRGAGMWHSRLTHSLVEPYAMRTVSSASFTALQSNAGPVRIYDLSLEGTAPYDQKQSGALRGRFGDASVFQNIWIEHQQVGMWLAHWPSLGGVEGMTTGLFVSGCRIRNTFADGINLCTSVENGTVVNCHVRGTQDDAFAQWSNPKNGFYTKNNVFKYCWAQLPLRGNGFALYGGENSLVWECLVSDTSNKCGIIASSAFNMVSFVSATFRGIDLMRCGGYLHKPSGGSIYGAVGLLLNRQDISDVSFSELNIISPTYYGIHFLAANTNWVTYNTSFSNVIISGHTESGIKVNSWVSDGVYTGATCEDVVIVGPGLQNSSPDFTILEIGTGNFGW